MMIKRFYRIYSGSTHLQSGLHTFAIGWIISDACSPFTVYRDYTGLDMELRGKYLKKGD
jgi:hypothetical protein